MNQNFLAHATISDLWIGLVFTLIGILIGAFANHFLAARRDVSKEDRAKVDAMAAREEELRAAMSLTEAESWILKKCIIPEGRERGHVLIMRADALGTWVRAGTHDFADDFDVSFQVRYYDAFESLLARGFFRREARDYYVLTGMGFSRANEEAQQGGDGDAEEAV